MLLYNNKENIKKFSKMLNLVETEGKVTLKLIYIKDLFKLIPY